MMPSWCLPACWARSGLLASKSTARLWPASGVAWSIVMALTAWRVLLNAATRDRDDLPLGITMAVVAMAISNRASPAGPGNRQAPRRPPFR